MSRRTRAAIMITFALLSLMAMTHPLARGATPISNVNQIISGGDFDAIGIPPVNGAVFRSLSNVTIRNLRVTGGDASVPQNEGAALRLEDCIGVTLDHCTSTANKNAGASFIRSRNCRVSFGTFTYNGGNGLGGVDSSGIVVEDTLIAHNNRGVIAPSWAGWGGVPLGSFTTGGKWYLTASNEGGGGKYYRSSGTFRRCWFDDNGGVGAWEDWLNGAHVFEDCWFTGNTQPPGLPNWTGIGLGFEANNGPLTVTRCYFRGNSNVGLAIQESRNVTVTNCVFDGNGIEFRLNGDRIGNGGTGNVLVQNCGFIACRAAVSVGNVGGDNIRFVANTFTQDGDRVALLRWGETGKVGTVTAPLSPPIGSEPTTQPSPTTQPTITITIGTTKFEVVGGQIRIGGVLDTVTSNVVALKADGGNAYQKNSVNDWYVYTGTIGQWSHVVDPIVIARLENTAPPAPSDDVIALKQSLADMQAQRDRYRSTVLKVQADVAGQ